MGLIEGEGCGKVRSMTKDITNSADFSLFQEIRQTSWDDLRPICAKESRSLEDVLRLGAHVSDVSRTTNSTPIQRKSADGHMYFARRHGGVKELLRELKIDVPYHTIMRYKWVAERLRASAQVDPRIPLEWLLFDPEGEARVPAALKTIFCQNKKSLQAYLAKHGQTIRSLQDALVHDVLMQF